MRASRTSIHATRRPGRIRGSARVCALVGVVLTSAFACSRDATAPPLTGPDGTDTDTLTVVARGLEVPWDIAFLPGGDLLITERPGRLVRMGPDGTSRWSVPVEGVDPNVEGGLLGLALHPGFATNGWVYLYLTTAEDDRVVRYRLGDGGALTEKAVMLEGIPRGHIHNGGRIRFGPDGFLYATTGEGGTSARARDPASLGGKILRLSDDGRPAPGNPFGGYVYTIGHRDPEGITWAEDGTLWETEHGASGFDEINVIRAGADYGWPEVQGKGSADGVTAPVATSGGNVTWAPASAEWVDGRLFFGGLRGEALYVAVPGADGGVEVRAHLVGRLGRVRTVRLGPDGRLWILTSNRDGRGTAHDGDDQVLVVDPAVF